MVFWRSSAGDKDTRIQRLQHQLQECKSQLSQSRTSQTNLQSANADLQRSQTKLQEQHKETAQELAQKTKQAAGIEADLADTKQQLQKKSAECNSMQNQLNVLAQHLNDEALKKGGECTVAIKFDTQQRQQQYEHAVKSLLQPLEDKYVLDVRFTQEPTACNLLLYVTFSSTVRLVNFDKDAYEDFRKNCATGDFTLYPLCTVLVKPLLCCC